MPFFGGGSSDYKIVGTNIKGGTGAMPAVIGDNNIALGLGSMNAAINTDRQIAIGTSAAGAIATGYDNIYVGYVCGYGDLSQGTNPYAPQENVAIGNGAFNNVFNSATGNVVIGYAAVQSTNDYVNQTVLIGERAGSSLENSNQSVGVGSYVFNGGGQQLGASVAVGYSAGSGYLVTSVNNVFIGYGTGSSGTTLGGTQNSCTFIGYQAGFTPTVPNMANCIAIGYQSFAYVDNLVPQNGAIIIGSNSGLINNTGDLSNSIIIGNGITSNTPNKIIIGGASHTAVEIGGVPLGSFAGGLTARWSTLPAASTVPDGTVYRVTNLPSGSMWRSTGVMWVPHGGGEMNAVETGWLFAQGYGQTGITSNGLRVPTTVSAATAAGVISNTDALTKSRRVEINTGSAAGASCEYYQNTPNFVRQDGFYFSAVFGSDDAVPVAGVRSFCGVSDATTAFTNIDPSAMTDSFVGMGNDAADANMQIIHHNNGGGGAVKVDLGAAFPVGQKGWYLLELSFDWATTDVYYQVTNLLTGATASGTLTTKTPPLNSLMSFHMWRNNNASLANAKAVFSKVFMARYE